MNSVNYKMLLDDHEERLRILEALVHKLRSI
jgi:hypothetical protein